MWCPIQYHCSGTVGGMLMESYAKTKYRKLTFKRNNLFNVDLSTPEGIRKYQKYYQRFYRKVRKLERELHKNNRLNGYHKPVELEENDLVKLLKKVTVYIAIPLCCYTATYMSMMTIVFNAFIC